MQHTGLVHNPREMCWGLIIICQYKQKPANGGRSEGKGGGLTNKDKVRLNYTTN